MTVTGSYFEYKTISIVCVGPYVLAGESSLHSFKGSTGIFFHQHKDNICIRKEFNFLRIHIEHRKTVFSLFGDCDLMLIVWYFLVLSLIVRVCYSK